MTELTRYWVPPEHLLKSELRAGFKPAIVYLASAVDADRAALRQEVEELNEWLASREARVAALTAQLADMWSLHPKSGPSAQLDMTDMGNYYLAKENRQLKAYRAEYMAILKACSDCGFSDTEDVPLSAIVLSALQTLRHECDDLQTKGTGAFDDAVQREHELVALTVQLAALQHWLPTAAAVNALPEPLRHYIHGLETRCDPAGDTRELTIARDTIRALEAQLAAREQEQANDPLKDLRAAKYLNGVCGADGCQWLRAEADIAALRRQAQQLRALVKEWRDDAAELADATGGMWIEPGVRRACADELEALLALSGEPQQ